VFADDQDASHIGVNGTVDSGHPQPGHDERLFAALARQVLRLAEIGGIRMASFPPQPPINNMVNAVTAGSTWRRVSLMLFKNHHTESFQSSEVICRMMYARPQPMSSGLKN
jgi:hypothetical protein